MVKKIIEQTIKKHNLINAGEHIVIGLSGGPDSVCLFSVLNELKDEIGFSLHAVHVNHGFRPGAAEEDQAYAEQLCGAAGIECTSFAYDCAGIAKELGLTSEEAGRKVRYEAFAKVADSLRGAQPDGESEICKCTVKIAVAHNADDQAETVLFRLIRGTGTDGLAGMAYSRKEGNNQIIRPLLDVWRKDIEAYCEEHGMEPRTDHTNLQPIYTRNKIRLDLIPYVQENFNGNIMEALGRLSSIASEDKDFLWKCADEAFGGLVIDEAELQGGDGVPGEADVDGKVKTSVKLNQQGLTALDAAVRHRVVMKALQQVGLEQDVTWTHLEALDGILWQTGESKTVELPDGYRISVRYGEVVFYRIKESSNRTGKPSDKNASLLINVYSMDSLSKNDWSAEVCAQRNQLRLHGQAADFDYDKIKASHGDTEIILRTRMPGDYIAIGSGRKKLQNLFVDMKVPKEHRDAVLLAAIGSEILWLPQQIDKGVAKARYSTKFKLDADTKNGVKLEFVCEI